jgi:hypothetical protein
MSSSRSTRQHQLKGPVLKDIIDYYGALELADPRVLQYQMITARQSKSSLFQVGIAVVCADI